MSNRYSKQYNQKTIDESLHLKKYITCVSSDKSFKCNLGKDEPRLYENLLIHIESEAHLKKKRRWRSSSTKYARNFI